MDKKKILTILKSVAIILVLVCFVFLLRAQAYDLTLIPEDQKSMFTDSSGLPYFSEMDSYYNLRLTEDYIDHGYFGDEIKNGTPWDNLSYAPDGRSAAYPPMIGYVTAFLYYLSGFFGDYSVKEVAFWTGAIIASLAAIPAYIIVRRVTNDFGAISAALLVAFAPSYFAHTFAGFFDTDMFNVIFPLLITLFFIESIRLKRLVYRIIFILATVASLALFSVSWDGYIFYPALLVIIVIVYFIASYLFKLHLFKPFKDYPNKFSWFVNQKEIFSIVLIGIISFISLVLIVGFDSLIANIQGTLVGGLSLQDTAALTSNYPNVAISIAELQIPNLLVGGIVGMFLANSGGVINGMGGILSFLGAFAILFLFAQRLWSLKSDDLRTSSKKPPKGKRKATSIKQESKDKSFFIDDDSIGKSGDVYETKRNALLYFTIFAVWIFIAIVAVSRGSRFLAILVIPVSLCAGIFVGYATSYITKNTLSNFKLAVISLGGAFLAAFPVFSITNQYIIPLGFFAALSIASLVLIYGIKGHRSLNHKNKIGTNNKNSKSRFISIRNFVVMLIILLAFVSPMASGAYQVANNVVPGTSDPMWNAMEWVKANTTDNTVIISWWDYGYLFEIAGDRPTSFDGGSQTGDRAFWVGKAMTTNNTDLSAGIFEMLATTGDNAYLALDNYTNNTGKSVEILEKTLPLSREEAKTAMTEEYNLSSIQADTILKYSHPPNPTPVIFVASSDMLGKAGWWTYFGNWDFAAKSSVGYQYLTAQVPAQLEKINSTVSQATITNSLENGIAVQTVVTKGVANNTTNATVKTVYENGTQIIDQNGTLYNPFPLYNKIIIEEGILMVNETVNESGNFTLLVIGNNGTYSSIIMSKELENALFTRLFILGGYGQDRFEMVNMQDGVSLWRINPKS
ncbi:oligosaccharyl transferase STT3 subunit [Methanobrevibacter cuticularis]|uniref:dolichyl-phosphooligosaccharide-protein glycotransferase n=1 Tax=Methanobrevibacter cuticularis TaxID=47311 RepID=A0A166EKC9_9EURY|nr:STT3 domain-containing protein [Methanobrevibacter cuticularis]KZX16753.1 oligosaccharyl transferase STT3 subunit [Methanobrevibacter cuticularis]